MSTITEKITACLQVLNKLETEEGSLVFTCLTINSLLEFSKLATLVRYDMLGYQQEDMQHLSEQFDLGKY